MDLHVFQLCCPWVSTYACVMWWWPLSSMLARLTGLTNPSIVTPTKTGQSQAAAAKPGTQYCELLELRWGEGSCLSSSGQNILTSGVCWHGMGMTRCEHLRSQQNGSPGRCRVAASCPVMDIAINTHLSVGYYHPTPPPPWHSDTGRRLQNICRQGASDRIL